MNKLTIQICTVVVQEIVFDHVADMDDETFLCEDAQEEAEGNLESADFKIDHSNTLVKWEHT